MHHFQYALPASLFLYTKYLHNRQKERSAGKICLFTFHLFLSFSHCLSLFLYSRIGPFYYSGFSGFGCSEVLVFASVTGYSCFLCSDFRMFMFLLSYTTPNSSCVTPGSPFATPNFPKRSCRSYIIQYVIGLYYRVVMLQPEKDFHNTYISLSHFTSFVSKNI